MKFLTESSKTLKIKIFELTCQREGGPGWPESSKIQRTGYSYSFLSENNDFKPLLGLFYPQIPVKSQKFKEEGSSVFGEEDTEMKKLRSQVKRLRDERDILKKAVTFFAKHEG